MNNLSQNSEMGNNFVAELVKNFVVTDLYEPEIERIARVNLLFSNIIEALTNIKILPADDLSDIKELVQDYLDGLSERIIPDYSFERYSFDNDDEDDDDDDEQAEIDLGYKYQSVNIF